MESIAFNFALDVQEKAHNNDFITTLKIVMKEYIHKIDNSKSTSKILAFTDNSGCEFDGHNIVLIDNI